MNDWDVIVGWIAAAVTVTGIAWAPVSCTASNNEKIAEAIKSGVDPIKANCAYSAQPDRLVCALAASKEPRHAE